MIVSRAQVLAVCNQVIVSMAKQASWAVMYLQLTKILDIAFFVALAFAIFIVIGAGTLRSCPRVVSRLTEFSLDLRNEFS